MTSKFDALLPRVTKTPHVLITGRNYRHPDGNFVTDGEKRVNNVVTERGIFCNEHLVLPASMIPKDAYVKLEAVRSFKKAGIRKKGEFCNEKLIRGTIICPNSIHIGLFGESERIKEGLIIQKFPFATYTFEGRFIHGTLRKKPIIQCNGTITYAVSKFQEKGTFIMDGYQAPQPKTDALGRTIAGRISFPEYHLEGVISYSPNGTNILCEGKKTEKDLTYEASGVFVNGTQLKGVILYKDTHEKTLEDQIKDNEDLLDKFMTQDSCNDFHVYCAQQRAIPPFRLYLDQ